MLRAALAGSWASLDISSDSKGNPLTEDLPSGQCDRHQQIIPPNLGLQASLWLL
jgi:hypothetical protein